MFGEDVSGKFLEKWTTTFKRKILQQCRKLPSTSEIEDLLLAADTPEDGTEVDDDIGKDELLLKWQNHTGAVRGAVGKVAAPCRGM